MQGYIVVITRNGSLGERYPVTSTECLFGQGIKCDVRVFVASVARKHCLISTRPGEPAFIRNLSPNNVTLVNGNSIGSTQHELQHADVVTVGGRHFRWEYPFSSKKTSTPKPMKKMSSESQTPKPVTTSNRHSCADLGELKKKETIISEDEREPNPKRRKTIQNVTDLSIENKSAKPVNKRLLAVTQPASSPKSFNTFRVLLKSSKRKTISRISKTPKPPKKIVSTKIKRAKSLSPARKSSLNKSSEEFTKIVPVEKSNKKKITPKKEKRQSQKMSPSVKQSPQYQNNIPTSSSAKAKSASKRKSTLATPLKIKTPKLNHSPKSSQKKNNPGTKSISPKIMSPTPEKNSVPAAHKTPILAACKNNRKSNILSKIKSPQTPKTLSKQSETPNKNSPLFKKTPTSPNSYSKKSSPRSPKAPLKLKTPEKLPHSKPLTKDQAMVISPKTPIEKTTPRKLRSAVKHPSPNVSEKNTPTRNESLVKITGHKSPEEEVLVSESFFALTPKTPKESTNSSKKSMSLIRSSSLTQNRQRVSNSLSRRSRSQSTSLTPTESFDNSLQSNSTRKSAASISLQSVNSDDTMGQTPKGKSKSVKKGVSLRKSSASQPSRDMSPVGVSSLVTSPLQKSLSEESQKDERTSRSRSKTPRRGSSVSSKYSLSSSPPNKQNLAKTHNQSQITPEVEGFSLLPQEVSISSTPEGNETTGRRSRSRTENLKENKSSIPSPHKSPAPKSSSEDSVNILRKSPRNSFTTQSLDSFSPRKSRASTQFPSPMRTDNHSSKTPIFQEKRKSQFFENNSVLDATVLRTTHDNIENTEDSSYKTISSDTNLQSNVESVATPASIHVRHNRASILRKSYSASLSQQTTDEVLEGGTPALKSARRSALQSGLSSSRRNTLVIEPKSSLKKNDKAKLQSNTKRKFDNDFEARAERAAKKLKMETPRSLSKNKVAALLVCHGRSPKNVQRKPLFSEVLKSHLSAAKRKKPIVVKPVVAKKQIKQKIPELSMEVPKHFKFNSTGHANSPETIVITKKYQKTPAPKTRKGRKSANNLALESNKEQNLEGVEELFKTPSKLMVSSLKTATSVKKQQNVRVRFSLQNDIQSPSGRRSFVRQQEEVFHFGSPMVPPMRYVGTPRPPKLSEQSLVHTSIAEESPLAQEINSSRESPVGSPKRKSNTSLSSSVQSPKSLEFSIYSPSSPTLQFSQISGCSNFARKSIDFSDFSPVLESNTNTPKLRSSMSSSDDYMAESSSRRFSFAGSAMNNSSSTLNSNIDESDLSGPVPDESKVSRSKRGSRRSGISHNNSINTSGASRFSGNHSEPFNRSNRSTSQLEILNVSQIPLPSSPSPKQSSAILRTASSNSLSSIKTNESIRSTRSTRSNENPLFVVEVTKSQASVKRKRSRSSTFNLTNTSENILESPKSSKSGQSSKIIHSSSASVLDAIDVPTRISSTPKFLSSTNMYSPVSSPIISSGRRSHRNQTLLSENQNSTHYDTDLQVLEESATDSVMGDDCFKTPTPGKRGRKRSARMYASNSADTVNTPESKVPVAAVKPSARKKQENESTSSVTESVSLPDLAVVNDVSGRSLDRSLAQKILDSRVSSGFDQPTANDEQSFNSSDSSTEPAVISSSSGRRKRKSSASTSVQSLDTTNFDFNSVVTPRVPREMFVSPLDKGKEDLIDVTGVKRVLSPKGNSPVSSYVDVKGVKRLLQTPRPTSPVANYTNVEGIKDLFKTSPVADYTNVLGVKRIYGAQTEPNYMNVKGVRRIFKEKEC